MDRVTAAAAAASAQVPAPPLLRSLSPQPSSVPMWYAAPWLSGPLCLCSPRCPPPQTSLQSCLSASPGPSEALAGTIPQVGTPRVSPWRGGRAWEWACIILPAETQGLEHLGVARLPKTFLLPAPMKGRPAWSVGQLSSQAKTQMPMRFEFQIHNWIIF